MRLSRLCYDKAHRCPGWNGGGNHYPKGVSRCEGGRINLYDKRLWRWRFHRCDTCNVVTWPYVTRYLDPTNWGTEIRWQIRKLKDWIYELSRH